MKPIYRLLIFVLLVSSLNKCKKDVPNTNIEIPDKYFLNALLELGVDTNGDGLISPAEAKVITYLDVSGTQDTPNGEIENILGIEAFIDLDTFICSYNLLSTLDFPNNTRLEYLDCRGNQLSNLDVTHNTDLKKLFCGKNQLTTLDVSKNTPLKYLSCPNNQLTNLDVSNNTELITLYCPGNQLTTLDLSCCTFLNSIYIFSNQLTILDLPNSTELKSLNCENNQLTSLEVSNNSGLKWLFCGFNQLKTLDLLNNIHLSRLHLLGMPTLNKVCIWETPFPPVGVELRTTGSPNVYFTTTCTN